MQPEKLHNRALLSYAHTLISQWPPLYSSFIGCPCIIQICKFRYKKNLEIKDRKVPARHPLLPLLGPHPSGHRHEVTERLHPSHRPSPGPPVGPHPVRPWPSGRHSPPESDQGGGRGKHSIGSEHSVGREEALSLCCVYGTRRGWTRLEVGPGVPLSGHPSSTLPNTGRWKGTTETRESSLNRGHSVTGAGEGASPA